MANNNNIKGISVEIGADSSKFAETLKNITKDCGKLQSELTKVNKALKFDPESAVLAAQKQVVLKEAAEKTAEKLELLKQKQESMNKALNSGKISGQEYREFQREIEATRSKLTYYSSELEKAKQNTEALSESSADAKGNIKGLGNELNSASKEAEELSDANKNAKESLKSLGKEAEKYERQLMVSRGIGAVLTGQFREHDNDVDYTEEARIFSVVLSALAMFSEFGGFSQPNK